MSSTRRSRPLHGLAARFAAPLAAALVLSACGQKPAQIRVLPGKVTIYGLGRTVGLQAEVLDKKGAVIPDKIVEWSSAKPDVATVEAGIVKGVKPGKTQINATFEKATGSANVEVVDAATMMVTPMRITLAGPKGTTTTFAAEVKDTQGKAVVAKPTWASSNPKVATIDHAGVATSVGEGKTAITATLGDLGGGADLAITFREIASLEVLPRTLIMTKGESQLLRVTTRDTLGGTIEDPSIAWTSLDPRTATVFNGMVKGVAPGSTTIRATCGSQTAEVSVLVN